jgi:hypothetical protein
MTQVGQNDEFGYYGSMVRTNQIAGAIAALFLLTSQASPLPADVQAFLHRQAENNTCRPAQTTGKTPNQLVQEFLTVLASKACAAQEEERRLLADRYKGNDDVRRALTPKIGFVGAEGFDAPAPGVK